MAKPKSNFVIVLGVGALAFVVALAVMYRVLGGSGDAQASVKENQGASDTPTESLKAMSTQLADVQKSYGEVEEQRKADLKVAKAENQKNLSEATQQIHRNNQSMMGKMENQIAELKRLLQREKIKKPAPAPVQYDVTEPPKPNEGRLGADGRIWFSAAAQPVGANGQPQTLSDRIKSRVGNIGGQTGSHGGIVAVGDIRNGSTGSSKINPVLPVYTIPDNSTLMESTAMTAIIGRVPFGGQIRDPIPFKVITGGENLSANNMYLPEVEKAIWTGYAAGDSALECTTGKLTSVTFVFRDGTIITQKSKNKDEGLGWISNEQGFPCIPGTFVSNAPSVMRKLFAAGFATGAAGAFAQAQTTVTAGANGSLVQTITGGAGEFALGQGAAAGFQEWARYVAERAKDTFDAVVVKPGINVAINISEAILIDYNSQGRKIRHLENLETSPIGILATGGID